MSRFLLVLLLVLLAVAPNYAEASVVRYVEDFRFVPSLYDTYDWQEVNGYKYVTFTKGAYSYRVFDYGRTWGMVTLTGQNTMMGMCPQTVKVSDSFWDCLPRYNGDDPLSKTMNGYPNYFIRFGHYEELQAGVVSIYPDGGKFEGYVDVTITSTDPTAWLYYSLDGSYPMEFYYGPFRLTESAVVKARGNGDLGSSDIVEAYFEVSSTPSDQKPLTLQISPDTHILDPSLTVTLIPSESEATVFYSVDGSEPSIRYTSPIVIDRPLKLKAKVVMGDRSSPVYERDYILSPIQRTNDKFFHVNPDMQAVTKNAADYIKVASPGMWLFVVAFLGLLIFGIVRRVFNR